MAKFGHGVGLSVEDHGGKWILRWRQDEEQPDGSQKRVQRAKTVHTLEELRHFQNEIESALRTQGWWQPPADRPAMPLATNLEAAARDWLAWKTGTRGVSKNTRGNLARSMKRFFRELRAVAGLRADQVVPGPMLTEANVNACTLRWREKYGEGTVYQTIAAVLDMWTWVADDRAKYSDVPLPPYNRDRVRPPAPAYEAPEAAPSWAEADACVRRVRLPFPRRLAMIMRYTGLRLEQVVMIHREDFDLHTVAPTLLIRKGKSRREQALMRRVPVSRHLVDDLGDWLRAHPAGPLFPDLKAKDEDGKPLPMKSYRNHTRYITEAWQAATEAEEARLEVWAPPNRKKARPDHAFRAALQNALEAEGYGEAVVDRLVGHTPKNTRGKHYARPTDQALREAVDFIPAVDWKEELGKVLQLRRRARA